MFIAVWINESIKYNNYTSSRNKYCVVHGKNYNYNTI